ncbi:hypothetical protein QYZ87_04195 [Porphyromonadaceae bacterium W3.11]|nr:hypothetical protein [Porphyromonadaceae bacterium W3.11]
MTSPIFYYNVADVLVPVLAIVINICLYERYKTKNKRVNQVLVLMIVEHSIMTVFYYLMTLQGGNFDALGYFNRGVVNSQYYLGRVDFRFGTPALIYIVHYLNKLLGLNYFALYWPFSILGLIGIVRTFKVSSSIISERWTNLFYLFLLPNLHFWSCALGKDALAMYAIGSIIYLVFFQKKIVNCIFAVILFSMVRVHIVALVAFAFLITVIFKGNIISFKGRILTVFVMLVLAIPGYVAISETIALQDAQSINEKFQELEQTTAEGGSTVNMQGKNIIVKWTSYLFRPLFFDARNLLTFLASLENTVWVLLFFYYIKSCAERKRLRYEKDRLSFFYWFSIFSILSISIPNAAIMYNLGLAMRQKYMFFPFVLMVIFILKSNSRKGNYI